MAICIIMLSIRWWLIEKIATIVILQDQKDYQI